MLLKIGSTGIDVTIIQSNLTVSRIVGLETCNSLFENNDISCSGNFNIFEKGII